MQGLIFDFKFEYKVCMTVSICLSEVFSDRHIVAIKIELIFDIRAGAANSIDGTA